VDIVNISGQSILHVDEHVDIVNISGQLILHVDEHDKPSLSNKTGRLSTHKIYRA
jgi:hypothetical protein